MRYVVLWMVAVGDRIGVEVAGAEDIIEAMEVARAQNGIFFDAETAQEVVEKIKRVVEARA